jgi:hypothetical protein
MSVYVNVLKSDADGKSEAKGIRIRHSAISGGGVLCDGGAAFSATMERRILPGSAIECKGIEPPTPRHHPLGRVERDGTASSD